MKKVAILGHVATLPALLFTACESRLKVKIGHRRPRITRAAGLTPTPSSSSLLEAPKAMTSSRGANCGMRESSLAK